MIRGVLFDYGGVIADGGNGGQISSRLSEALSLPPESTEKILLPLFVKFTRELIDEANFWQEIEMKAHQQITEAQRHIWDDWWGTEPYPEMLEVIAKLKAAQIPVGLLSNIIPPAKRIIEASGGYSHFDFAILSCEVGYAKPDAEIYDMAIAKFNGLQSEELVFVDDQTKCMPPAQALGIETILAVDTDQVIDDLRKLDLLV